MLADPATRPAQAACVEPCKSLRPVQCTVQSAKHHAGLQQDLSRQHSRSTPDGTLPACGTELCISARTQCGPSVTPLQPMAEPSTARTCPGPPQACIASAAPDQGMWGTSAGDSGWPESLGILVQGPAQLLDRLAQLFRRHAGAHGCCNLLQGLLAQLQHLQAYLVDNLCDCM